MEPPHWYYPVRQSLGAVLLLSGDLQGAEEAFRTSLREAPNNGWALYGLSEVYRRRDDGRQADVTRKRLEQAWAGDRRVLDLARL
ncbi:MAG: tetratricopeptide repeat protein, partial [Gemmatimonadales bacterium]